MSTPETDAGQNSAAPSQYRAASSRHSAASSQHSAASSQHRADAPSEHRADAPSEHRADAPSQHRAAAPTVARCFVLTVSDTRTPETDSSGRAIRDLLVAAGHEILGHRIVRDEPSEVAAAVRLQLADARTQAVITTGGTGISSRDGTFEAIDALFEKRLDGFGELFRMLSYQEIGAAAMLSRATAGTARRRAIFVLPGSEHAVRLALTKLVIPELGHVLQQLNK